MEPTLLEDATKNSELFPLIYSKSTFKKNELLSGLEKNGLLMPFGRCFLHLAQLQLEALIGLEPASLGATSSQPTGAISLNRCRWELLHHVEGFDGLFFFIWRR